MQHTIKNTSLSVFTSQNLSLDDISVITLLYGPLIGPTALQLYLSFTQMCSKQNHRIDFETHSDLYDLLHIKEQDFIKARFSLEGIGLLDTYFKDNEYIYLVYLPQSASSFIKNGVLGIYLNSLIGQNNLNKILSLFSHDSIDLKEYNRITKSFDDIYKTDNVNKEQIKVEKLSEARRAKEINLSNDKFDIEYFLKKIDLSYIDNFADDKFKTTILNVSSAFNLSLEDIISLYNQSIGQNQKFSYVIFKRKARMLYNMNNDNSMPILVKNIKEDENESKEGKKDLFKFFEELSGQELLQKFNLDTSKNSSLLANIYQDIPFSRTVVNMMVWSVISKNNDHLPALGYFESMYNSMRDSGVLDEKTAYSYLFNQAEKKEKKISNKVKNINNPDWVKKAQKTLFDSVEVYDEEN